MFDRISVSEIRVGTDVDLIGSFQGFDSGIYSIIVSDGKFTTYFNLSSAQLGVMASMGTCATGVSHITHAKSDHHVCSLQSISATYWETYSWPGGSFGTWDGAMRLP